MADNTTNYNSVTTLHRRILKAYPTAKVLEDFRIEDNARGTVILALWNTEKLGAQPEPSALADIDMESTIANAEADVARRNSYGEWREQLDEIYHDMDAWKARITTIKNNNPKT